MKIVKCLTTLWSGALLCQSAAPAQSRHPDSSPIPGAPAMSPSLRPPPKIKPQIQNMPAGDASRPGDPLPGLTDPELALFAEGMEEFNNTEDAAGGLGPVFNNSSCVSCHGTPGIGGSSNQTVTRFGHAGLSGFDPLESLGGSLLQARAIAPGAKEIVPPEATVRALRQSTPLFGLGLIEAIPDASIVNGAKRQKPDGVTGKVHFVQDAATGRTRAGKFGWKAQQATLLAFSGDAYVNEMGITNRFFPTENAPDGDIARLLQYDLVLDPEDTIDPATGRSDIDAAANFMRLLAPLETKPLSRSAAAGQKVFHATGCAVCHVPEMRTGPNEIAALNLQPVHLYSDLLLHDMGALGDGITQGQANGKQMKTAPLWGVGVSGPWLHDGRAATLDAAVRAHAGEAWSSANRYGKLTKDQQRQLVEFLSAL